VLCLHCLYTSVDFLHSLLGTAVLTLPRLLLEAKLCHMTRLDLEPLTRIKHRIKKRENGEGVWPINVCL
jgi:hypothetical protein